MYFENLLEAAAFNPKLLGAPSAWLGHLPFAGWVIRETRPKVFVELGTHAGHSYFAFCQSVKEAGLLTKCYAVDTWSGDGVTTGNYGKEIFSEVDAYNQARYEGFSRLLQMTFDDALTYFADESIDLLHIDGLHTYEAVRHDFETWLPKLAPGAVVMFHDTMVHAENFGVWKLWLELKDRYPNNLEFVHSSGLGVLQLNNSTDDKKLAWLRPEFSTNKILIDYFCALGSRQYERYDLAKAQEQVLNLTQVDDDRDSQVAKRNYDSLKLLCCEDRKRAMKHFMSYEDFLSLMDEDLRVARESLKKHGINYHRYNERIDDLIKSKRFYSFRFVENGKTVHREQGEIKSDATELRVQIHHQWLARLTQLISLPNLRFCIEIEDMADDTDIPVLSYHKKHGQNIVLIPDFEIFGQNYYRRGMYIDNLAFQEKSDKAIFFGSTTGTNAHEDRECCNTIENIDHDPSVRISAAKFFDGSESVVFKLPLITQCDSIETEEYLRKFPFTQCDRAEYNAQFNYKFIISVDGNGPTCTRVAVALLSNSVLLKYSSQWITYYHRALRPFVNYIPITCHDDVNYVLNEINDNYQLYSAVSHRASEDFLPLFKKSNVDRYFGVVLN